MTEIERIRRKARECGWRILRRVRSGDADPDLREAAEHAAALVRHVERVRVRERATGIDGSRRGGRRDRNFKNRSRNDGTES